MKIWFDLSNSPHINLFSKMIRDLEKDHEIIITCRPLGNTIDLLDLYGFKYTVVGKHYGKKLLSKIYGYPVRVYELYKFLKVKKPDVAVSQSSFHSPLVAKLLGIKSIYMNDNEYALGNVPSFLFATIIMIPEYLDKKKVYKQGALPKKVIQYPGLKEGIYLWHFYESLKNKNINLKKREKIYVRPEPWIAQYYKGAIYFLDDLLIKLKEYYKVVLLPRGKEQAKHYKDPKFKGIIIQEKPLSLEQIIFDCFLFIGAGGTMTREMAILGIPTISVYQDRLLDVDKYLINIGQMVHMKDVNLEKVLNFIESIKFKPPKLDLLEKGKKAYNLIKNKIIELGCEK